jgi:hypothetical protein
MKKIKVKVFSCFLEYILEAISCDPDKIIVPKASYCMYTGENQTKAEKKNEIDL